MEAKLTRKQLQDKLDAVVYLESQANKALQEMKEELEKSREKLPAVGEIKQSAKSADGFQQQLSTLADIQRRNRTLFGVISVRLQSEKTTREREEERRRQQKEEKKEVPSSRDVTVSKNS